MTLTKTAVDQAALKAQRARNEKAQLEDVSILILFCLVSINYIYWYILLNIKYN